jgi:hypothetical protein
MKQKLPFYSQIWTNLKLLPKGLSQGAEKPPQTSGVAAAAILSASFACFFLMINQHISMLFVTWKEWLWTLGAWIPGSHNPDPLYGAIGPYAGKETIFLIGWVVSWFGLHQGLKNREVKPKTVFFWMFIFLIAATVMNWHPFFPYAPLT